MQAEPDTAAVPHQELHAGAFFPSEEEGLAFPRRMPGGLSGEAHQGVDAGAHVGRFANEPEGMRGQHRLSSRMMAAMPAGVILFTILTFAYKGRVSRIAWFTTADNEPSPDAYVKYEPVHDHTSDKEASNKGICQ